MPPLVSLSDEEMAAIRTAAATAPYAGRDAFVRAVTAELQAHKPDEIGVGLIARIVRALALESRFRPDYAVGPSPRRA